MRLLSVIVLLEIWCLQNVSAQSRPESEPDSLLSYFQFDDTAPLSCLFTYFPPFFIQNGIELKSFIRSETFHQIRERFGDVRAVDAVYIRAMQLTNNNTAIALLLSAVATFDHRIVGLKIPIFNLFFPLSNESFEEFTQRVNNLPARLYSDTQPIRTGDRDKLQHYFGSAFLTVVCESPQPAERIGDFIEKGEDAFIIDGALDERDRRANRQGQEFGLALLIDHHHVPSEFLACQVASKKIVKVDDTHCSGIW
jgi:hypothetical protein